MKPGQTQLELITEQIDKQPPKDPLRPIGQVPKCPLCGNWGYTGAEHAKLPDGSGDFPAVAAIHGTACTCPAGREWAKFQLAWISGAL